MRRYILSLAVILALCLFTMAAVAQTPGGTTGATANSSQSNQSNSVSKDAANSSAPVSGSATDPYSVNSGPNGRAAEASPVGSSSAGEKTLDGCIVKEQTDYLIEPAMGDRERLTGSDVSSHVGHHVKVHGTEAAASASNSSGAAGTTGSMASNDRTSTSGSASSESQNNAAGSIAGNAGSPNATGTAASSGSNWSGKDFMVTKVDMVSDSCPADIQKRIDENKSK